MKKVKYLKGLLTENILNRRWLKILLFCFSSLSLISWDRVTKDLAKEHLKDKAEYSYFHDSFRLQYAENTGAAMSFADSLPRVTSFWLLGIIPLVFLILLLVYMLFKKPKRWLLVN
jgi:signal peptidase II